MCCYKPFRGFNNEFNGYDFDLMLARILNFNQPFSCKAFLHFIFYGLELKSSFSSKISPRICGLFLRLLKSVFLNSSLSFDTLPNIISSNNSIPLTFNFPTTSRIQGIRADIQAKVERLPNALILYNITYTIL